MYYQNNNNSSSADPYAGQYPPPPPAPEAQTSSSTPSYQYSHQQSSEAYYTAPQPAPVPTGNDYYASAPAADAAVHRSNYYSPPQPAANDYYAPPLATNTNNHYNQPAAYDPSTYYPHPNTSYYAEDLEDVPTSPRTPIIDKSKSSPLIATASSSNNASSSSSSDAKKKTTGFFGMKKNKSEPAKDIEKQQSVPLHPVSAPQPAPADEKPTYIPVPRPYEERSRPCCCYNPALTCCSVFCMLIALAFVAAGVAMMIASKIVRDKCNNECGGGETSSDGSFSMPNNCTVICSNVLHDGLLYGGAVVAGLAGISVIWRFVMWCCAGYSRK